MVGPGAGDNAAVALGVGARPGDVIISIGTSGVVSAIADFPITDLSGEVIASADATGRFLWLAWTPIAARMLDAIAQILRVGYEEFSRLALSAPPGSEGLVAPHTRARLGSGEHRRLRTWLDHVAAIDRELVEATGLSREQIAENEIASR